MDGRTRAFLMSVTLTAAISAGAPAWAANGASAVDDADVGDPGGCKVESWAAFGEGGDFIGTVAPACVFSFGRPVEIGAQVTRSSVGGERGTSAAVKAKTNIIPSAPGIVGVGIAGGLGLDLITGRHNATFAYLPVTLPLNDTFKLSANIGWLNEPLAGSNWLTYGAGFEWNVTKPVTVIGEVFGLAGNSSTASTVTDPRFQAGLRFSPADAYDIDVFYGRNITGEGRHWITVGLNVRFDVPAFARR